MINNYDEYILENRGISNIIKQYTDIIFIEIKKNIEDNISDEIILDLDAQNDFILKNMLIDYKLSNRNYGLFDSSHIIFKDDILYNVIIRIEIDQNKFNDVKIKEIITHELTHILEYFRIKQNDVKLNLNINVDPNYISVRKSINYINFDNEWNSFKTLIYLSLDTEYNARIAQLYQFLIDFNSKDSDFLMNKFLNSETYKCYSYLDEFNAELFLIKLKMNIGENTLISEINRLNQELINSGVNKLNGYKFIKIVDIDNVEAYLNNWKNLFKNKNKKHIKKINLIIKEVISDVKDNKKWCDNFEIDESYKNRLLE